MAFFGLEGFNFSGMFIKPVIWLGVILVLGLLTIGMLWVKKKKKLQYPTFVITYLGNKKVGIELSRSGWFSKKQVFFGLWEVKGEQVLKLKDGRRIQGASSVDFHDFNGKRCLLVRRKDDDPKVLIPIRDVDIEGDKLMAAIAPADYRDASNEIIKSAENEMREKWKQILDYIVLGGIIIFALVSIIIISQMVTRSQQEASDLIKSVSQNCECNAGFNPSTTAP